MTETLFIAISGLVLFSLGMGITLGGLFGFLILIFRKRRSQAFVIGRDA